MRIAIATLALVVACKSEQKAPPPQAQPPAPPPAPAPVVSIDRDALLAGKLPDGAPETELVNAQCRICHAVDYLTQQRLGEAGWKKTIDKMRKFGATLTDEQAASLVAFATRYWNPDLPGRTWTLGPPPAGALPIAAAATPAATPR